jgi:Outer membrane protein beta-barrel domain
MQENEFEKRIQEEMGEFRLRPSETVWQKVEEQLQKKKRRRVIFYISMLAGFSLLGYTGYFITKTNSKQNFVQQDNNSIHDNNKSEPGNKQQILPTTENWTAKAQPAIKEHPLSQTQEETRKKKTGDILINEKVTTIGNDVAVKQKERIKKISSDKYVIDRSAEKKNSGIAKSDIQPTETEKTQNDKSLNYLVDKTGISQPGIAKNNLQGDNKTTDQKNDSITIDQKINEPAKADSVIIAQSKADEAIAATRKKQSLSKIKWGIDLSAGRSSSRDNAFSILDIFDANKSLAMDYNSPGNATGGGGLSNARISPSDIKAGPAFRAGILGEMKISKRSTISSGLQYVYHSNKIQVGYYADTTLVVNNSFSQASRVDAIYRGIHQKEYTNRFHFIQIPIHYQLQLNKGVKLPILWSIGASAGYLFVTNGLVYDTTASGIYYRDNAAFNKFQFNLNTGLSVRFGNKSKIQWSLGPEFSLGMSKLMKDDFTKKQYLLYRGLTGRLFFQKRN